MYPKTCLYEPYTLKYLTGEPLVDNERATIEMHIDNCAICCDTIATLNRLPDASETPEEKAFLDANLDKLQQTTSTLIEKALVEQQAKSLQQNPSFVFSTESNPDAFSKKTYYFLVSSVLLSILLSASTVIFLYNSYTNLKPTNYGTEHNTNYEHYTTSYGTDYIIEESLVTSPKRTTKNKTDFRLSNLDYDQIKDSQDDVTTDQQDKLSSIILLLKVNVNKNPSANNHHILGQALIISHQYDEALIELSKASNLAPKNLAILNDLAAVQASKDDYNKALLTLNKAISINAKDLRCLFNRALVYQQLKEYAKARLDWENYLRLDDKSSWSEKARENLDLLN